MESSTSTAAGFTNLGAVAYREGRLDEARALFVRALLTDHENERAWLAEVTTEPAEQRPAAVVQRDRIARVGCIPRSS